MNAALLALALLFPPQDSLTAAPANPTSTTAALVVDSAPPSFAPTLENSSALAGIGPLVLGDLAPAMDDTVRRRPKAIQYSDLYYTRLKIHQVASYLTLPLFVGQYLSGRYLWNHPGSHGLARDAHGPLAAGVAGLFAVNTVTGVWNLWEGRKDPKGRTRRWVHGLTMLVADAGFVVVGATTPEREDRFGGTPTPFSQQSGARLHRDLAIGSMGLALGSYVMMLIWKD
jgi:hypothetical protein